MPGRDSLVFRNARLQGITLSAKAGTLARSATQSKGVWQSKRALALALTLTSSPTCSSKEIASRAEPQSGRALLMAGAFSTIREQSSQPKRTTWPLRRQSLSFVDRVSWPDPPGTLNSKIVPKAQLPLSTEPLFFSHLADGINLGDNPVDRSWLREKRRVYDREAIANPLGAHAQCFGTWGR
jgi:hypothetical protein